MEKQLATRGAGLSSILASPQIKSRFDEVLGKKAPSFVSSILTAVNGNKALQEANPMTVVSSAMIAASLDLPINASLGFAHIVPYGKDAQFQIGWKGLVQLGLRSGQYRSLNVTTVLDGQIKYINRFTGEIEFQDEAISDKVIGYLLYFKLLNGFEKYHYMSAKEAFDHGKKYSKSFTRGYGPWTDDFDAMALKTVVKMGLGKWGILSVEMQKAFEVDQAIVSDKGEVADYPDSPSDVMISKNEEPPKKEDVAAAKPKNFAPKSKEEAKEKADEINAKRDAEALEKAKSEKSLPPKDDDVIDADYKEVPEAPPVENPSKQRSLLLIGIAEHMKKLKMSNEDFNEMMVKFTKKTSKKDLTNEDLEGLFDLLKIELATRE